MTEELKKLKKQIEKIIDKADSREQYHIIGYLESMLDEINLAIEEHELMLSDGDED